MAMVGVMDGEEEVMAGVEVAAGGTAAAGDRLMVGAVVVVVIPIGITTITITTDGDQTLSAGLVKLHPNYLRLSQNQDNA
jgi:hypothetical protein